MRPHRLLLAGLALLIVVNAANAQTNIFTSARSFPGGGILIADFNGDGKADVVGPVSGNIFTGIGGGASVLLGNGDGTFGPATLWVVGDAFATLTDLQVADLNGDGHPDLIAGVMAQNNLVILLGNGDGTFGSGASYSVSGGAGLSLFVADVNGDGKPDLFASPIDGFPTVLFGNGDGTFQAPIVTGLSGSPNAVGDLNGDGKADVLMTVSGGVSIQLGKGDGTFLPAITTPTGQGANAVELADLNGDGKMDLAVSNGNPGDNEIVVLLVKGDGTFQPAVSYNAGNNPSLKVVGDVSGDGKPDLVALSDSGLAVLLGKGDGTFQSPVISSPTAATGGMGIADFNGDGKNDLIARGVFRFVDLLLGRGDGTFQTTPSYATGNGGTDVTTGDFNGDGKLDLLVPNAAPAPGTPGDNNLSVLLGNGDGTFQVALSFAAGNDPEAVVAGDFNGDGNSDIAVENISRDFSGAITGSSVNLLLSNGDGTFQAPVKYLNASWSVWLAVGDMDGDGKLDLVAASPNDNSVSVLLGKGDGTFGVRQVTTTPNSRYFSSEVVLGDFNNDGRLDVATVTSAGVASDGETIAGLTLLLGKGDGTFGTPLASAPITGDLIAVGITGMAVGDFNSDGILDLAVAFDLSAKACFPDCPRIQELGVLLGDGDGTFKTPVLYSMPFPPASFSSFGQTVTVGDFNADGHLDIAVRDNENHMTVLLAKGDGTFPGSLTASSYDGGPAPLVGNSTLAVGDFNSDGSPDVAGERGTRVSIFLNQMKGAPDYTVAANITNLTLHAGQTGLITLTLTPIAGFNGSVTFDCGPLPSQVTCTFTPNSLTLQGGPASTNLTIATVGPSTGTVAAMDLSSGDRGRGSLPWWLGVGTVGIVFARALKDVGRQSMLVSAFFLLLVSLPSCGGGSSSSVVTTSTPTPAGTYTVAVNASSTGGNAKHPVLVSLMVLP